MAEVGYYILCVMLAYPFIQNLSTLLHELGHALPALWLTKSEQVDIYINTYGKKEGAFRFSIGRLFFYWHPFNLKGYGHGLTVYQGPDRYIWGYVITAGGVLFSLFIAALMLWFTLYTDLQELWKVLAIVFFAGVVVDLFTNLMPNSGGIKLHNGGSVPNDGRKLYDYWKYHSVAVIMEHVFQLSSLGQQQQALEVLQGIELAGLSEGELRFLLGSTAVTGTLVEEQFWDDAFAHLSAQVEPGFTAWLNLGVIEGRRRNYEAALESFDKALAGDAGEGLLVDRNRAFVLLEMSRTAEAEVLFERLTKEDGVPYDIAHYGLCQARLGHLGRGWAIIEKALHLASTQPYVLRCAGLYHLEAGQNGQALAYFEQISEESGSIPGLPELIERAKESGQS